jgi:uncharacterized repeat protein (TIGR01451 family)
MAPGASTTYTCTLPDVTASFTNFATDTGSPPSGPNVTATDSAAVTVTTAPFKPPTAVVTHPSISILKNPKSQSIATGGTARFTITVKNTGDVALKKVTVTDPLTSDCSRALGTIPASVKRVYSCTRPDVRAGFVNVANVTGTPPSGPKVLAHSNAVVKVAPFTPPHGATKKLVTKPKPKPKPRPKLPPKPKLVSHAVPTLTG